MVLLEDDEMVFSSAADVFPGQAEAHSVPFPAVLPQQAQVVELLNIMVEKFNLNKYDLDKER